MKKKLLICFAVFALLILTIGPVLATKPENNGKPNNDNDDDNLKDVGDSVGAKKLSWQLPAELKTAASQELEKAAKSSKLIVNQPNGETKLILNGIMKGLEPQTTYTVSLSTLTEQQVSIGWSITGNWVFDCVGNIHQLAITQTGSTFTGTGTVTSASSTLYEVVSGTINPATGQVVLNGVFFSDPEHKTMVGIAYSASLTIDSTGKMSGQLTNIGQTGLPYTSTSGKAVNQFSTTETSGILSSEIPVVTFKTSGSGNGHWHLNLKEDDFSIAKNLELSELLVTISADGTPVLVSEAIAVQIS